MNVANPLPWLFIFILILAVIGAIAAIIWRSWIVGSILLVFVGLIFGLYMARVTVVPSAAPGMVNFQEATTPATPNCRTAWPYGSPPAANRTSPASSRSPRPTRSWVGCCATTSSPSTGTS